MSSLQQLVIKEIVLFFLCFFVFLEIGEAFKISASPSRLDFNLSVSERKCAEIYLFLDRQSNLIIEDRWVKIGADSKDLRNYIVDAEDYNIKLEYPKDIYAFANDKLEICISSFKSGEFNGVLLISAKDTMAEIGIWINLVVEGQSLNNIFTGFVGLENIGNTFENKPLVIIGLFTTLLLSGVLFYLTQVLKAMKLGLLSK